MLPHEEAERLNDVKFLVQQLYTTLRIEEHQLSKERELIGRLEDLNSQLRPLEKVPILDFAVYRTVHIRYEKLVFIPVLILNGLEGLIRVILVPSASR